jgi:hypothetical protein
MRVSASAANCDWRLDACVRRAGAAAEEGRPRGSGAISCGARRRAREGEDAGRMRSCARASRVFSTPTRWRSAATLDLRSRACASWWRSMLAYAPLRGTRHAPVLGTTTPGVSSLPPLRPSPRMNASRERPLAPAVWARLAASRAAARRATAFAPFALTRPARPFEVIPFPPPRRDSVRGAETDLFGRRPLSSFEAVPPSCVAHAGKEGGEVRRCAR